MFGWSHCLSKDKMHDDCNLMITTHYVSTHTSLEAPRVGAIYAKPAPHSKQHISPLLRKWIYPSSICWRRSLRLTFSLLPSQQNEEMSFAVSKEQRSLFFFFSPCIAVRLVFDTEKKKQLQTCVVARWRWITEKKKQKLLPLSRQTNTEDWKQTHRDKACCWLVNITSPGRYSHDRGWWRGFRYGKEEAMQIGCDEVTRQERQELPSGIHN